MRKIIVRYKYLEQYLHKEMTLKEEAGDGDVGLMAEQRQQRLMILIRPDVQDIDITQLTRLTKPQIHLR